METTIMGYIGYRIWGILLGLYIGIMEKEMETAAL